MDHEQTSVCDVCATWMQPFHVPAATFPDWSHVPLKTAAPVFDSDEGTAAGHAAPAQQPSKKPKKAKISRTNDPPVQHPPVPVFSGVPEGPPFGVNDPSAAASYTLNPFFEGFSDLSKSSSSSPSAAHVDVNHFFAEGVSTATTATAVMEEVCVLECETFMCCGGTWSVGVGFEECKKRPAKLQVKHHPRGVVCTVHHDFVKCQSCRLHVHVGCYVLQASGYKQIHRDVVFTCHKCTLKLQADVKPQLDAAKLDAPSDGAEGKKKTTDTICMFTNRQHLMQYARDHGWKCRSGGTTRCYFVCQKPNGQGCSAGFGAKSHSTDGDEEDGGWRAVNMPAQHDCCKAVMQTALTTRVCHLPRDAFQEIQRLACCKAFHSQSIQQYIKMSYGFIVDVPLIYNIGYRARNKLGIGDYTILVAQQAVRVYTLPSLCILT